MYRTRNQGVLGAGTGADVSVVASDGSVQTLRISGVGRNLNGGKWVTDDNLVVLYATPATVAVLGGGADYGSLAFRLADTRPAAVAATITAVRGSLRGVAGFTRFTALPDVRAAGDWPGKQDFQRFSDFFFVITALALLSALVLIANTMTTLVAEQTPEIGMMKAMGGRRRQIAVVYVRTALLLGALGTAAGIVLGIALSNVLVRYLGSTFFAIDVGFGVDWRILVASVLVGVLGPALAALPAIRRAVNVPLREALEASGSAVGAQDAGDRFLRRVRFLPRTAQIGLRGVGRRRRRSLATMLMVALAVGNLLAILGLAAAVSQTTHAEWRDHGEDVKLFSQGRPFDALAARLIRDTQGVATAEPMFVVDAKLDGEKGFVWAVRGATMFHYRIADGRWYTPAEERARARVAVVERNIARVAGTRVGDRVRVETATGPFTFRVIGVATNQQENGTALFVPLTTMHAILGDARSNDYWIRTTSHDHALVDRTTTQLEDTLGAAGYDVGTEIEYVGEADNVVVQPHGHDDDRRARLPDRRDQHGRARERDHDERDRAHARGRHPPHDRGAGPRRPTHLRDRERRARHGRLAARDPGRLPARRLPRLAGEGGRERRGPARVPAHERRARAHRDRAARPRDHTSPDPTRRPLPPRRGTAVRLIRRSDRGDAGVGRSADDSAAIVAGSIQHSIGGRVALALLTAPLLVGRRGRVTRLRASSRRSRREPRMPTATCGTQRCRCDTPRYAVANESEVRDVARRGRLACAGRPGLALGPRACAPSATATAARPAQAAARGSSAA